MSEITEREVKESDTQYEVCDWNITSTKDQCKIIYNTLNSDKPLLITIYNPAGKRD